MECQSPTPEVDYSLGGAIVRRLIIGVFLGAALFAVAPSARAAIFRIQVRDSFFLPTDLNIQTFDAVNWSWINTFLPHSTTADGSEWDSGLHSGMFVFRRVFTTPGDYPFYCSTHGSPGGIGMSGVIHVATRDHDDDDD
jgi:plastocyanin